MVTSDIIFIYPFLEIAVWFVSWKQLFYPGRQLPYRAVIPVMTRHWTNAGLMLAHRLQRWANINPTLVQSLFTGIGPSMTRVP